MLDIKSLLNWKGQIWLMTSYYDISVRDRHCNISSLRKWVQGNQAWEAKYSRQPRTMPAEALSMGLAISLTRNSALWIGSSGCSLYLPSLVLLLPWHGTFGLSGETNRLQKIYLLGTFVDWRLYSEFLRIYNTFVANFHTKNRSWQS